MRWLAIMVLTVKTLRKESLGLTWVRVARV